MYRNVNTEQCCSPLTVSVHFVDHVLKFSFCGILAERSHDGAQLLGGDCAIAVLVEQRECLLELGNLFFCQLVSLYKIAKNKQINTSVIKHVYAAPPPFNREATHCRRLYLTFSSDQSKPEKLAFIKTITVYRYQVCKEDGCAAVPANGDRNTFICISIQGMYTTGLPATRVNCCAALV